MASTQNFRNQHQALLLIVSEMSGLMNDAAGTKRNAHDLRRLLSKLAGQLKLHLAMEDDSLYPRLVAHADARVSGMARRYINEMGGLANAFGDYCDKYPSPSAIEQRPAEFNADSAGVFDALGKRIQRENTELYALVDSLK